MDDPTQNGGSDSREFYGVKVVRATVFEMLWLIFD